VLVGLLLVACGARSEVASAPTVSASGPTPTAGVANVSVSPSASPRRVAGSTVRVIVDGVEQPANAVLQAPLSGPLRLRLLFPIDIERAAFERFLPAAVTPTWVDDRTVDLLVPQGTSAFKAVELPSRDRSSVIDIVYVNVMFPPSRVVAVYSIADLTAAAPRVPDAAATPTPSISSRVHLPAQRGFIGAGVALSRDAKTILVYATPQNTGVLRVDVASDAARALNTPAAADGPFIFGDWLGDGRLLVVGRKAWIGSGDATALQPLADVSTADGVPDSVAVSADGRRAALSYHGRVSVLDLRSGVIGPPLDAFRPCAGMTAVPMTWSLDGTRLAGLDCPTDQQATVKIVDTATRRAVTTIPGEAYSLSTFPTGELLIVGPSGISGEGAPSLGVVLTFDGVERQRYMGGGWQLSPDGRYLLQMEPVGGAASELGTIYTLIDQRTALRYRLFLPWGSRWLADGRLAGF